jgi:acyl-CoA synthetase (AMP-forming)/AMP-acid ligase II
MTSNPVPPGERRIGTVGPAAGADVAVLAEGSVTRTPGVVGEVVVRGAGVMREYSSPSSANDTAWHDGWFRTGDLGSLDPHGYLTLHGRLKELINVSGEKVSPYDVESVLLRHPSVSDAVAFAAPDRIRGEHVCVAVVLRAGVDSLDEHTLRRFAADRLASFKAPRRIIILDEIPVGPTGKVQRSRLSSVLGLADVTS